MKIFLIAPLVFCLGVLSSCASGKIIVKDPHFFENSPDVATINVMRKSQMAGAAGKVEVYLDAESIAYLGPGDRVELYVKPGKHFIAASLAFKSFGDMERVISFEAEARKQYYFYYSMAFVGENYNLEQLSEEKGKQEVLSKNYKLLTLEK